MTLRPQLRPRVVGLRPIVSHSGKWLTTQPSEPNDQRFGKENIPSTLTPSLERIAEMPVRQRLQYWAKENESKKPFSMPAEANLYGTMLNSMSRTQTTKAADMNNLRPGPNGSQTGSATEFSLEHDEHAIVGTDTSKPGDMVEIRNAGSRMPILAIYLGFFGDRNHFYAANGLWNTSRGFSSLFTVSNFVRPEELQPILSKLPETGTLEDFEKMKEEERGPSREDAKALIDKMDDFRAQTEAVYQRNLAKLDAAHTLLSTSDRVRYLSLFQMADALLPKSILVDGEVPPAALYAVHTALTRNEFGFQPISSSRAIQRRDQLYEVFPKDQAGIIDKVCVLVREYVTLLTKKARNASASKLDDTPLGKFIAQARTAVLKSRRFREITPYGILKPSNGGTIPKPTWLSTSKDFILFLEYWASYGLFESSSRLHSNGAMILRSLGVYDNIPLTPTTAWTFLQEIGHIMPWEVPSRYKVRFPGTEILPGAGLRRQEPSIEKSKRKDIAAGVRQEVTAPVFCIDGSSTRVIDDGISVERTDNTKEFWVHVHAADPASGIKPNSELCKYMELIPDNIYLPGHFQAMLPTDLGDKDGDYISESLIKQYSLQKDCPSLTFSAKVNRQGEILEYKVEPSTLRNVVYMEPEDVSRFCLEPRPKKRQCTELTVGKKPATQGYEAERNMVLAKDLEKAEQEDVLLLHELTHAIRDRRLRNGAWPYFFPRPSVSIEFDTTKRDVVANEIAIPADPGFQLDGTCR
ncbi:hypothetical protein NQ176_g9553 [Zarea fungicola]|uniref:Uncharacterized protein n=1 Tax=Zarea fungicola TaxID=93591 RepID=A0ACC1MM95_9HYPO|nr:hypothetical protein NQ176_g9553 [Lecanicillium fungicola]